MKCLYSTIILFVFVLIYVKNKDDLMKYFSIWCIIINLDLAFSQYYFGNISKKYDWLFAAFIVSLNISYSIFKKISLSISKKYRFVLNVRITYKRYIYMAYLFTVVSIIIGIIRVRGFSYMQIREAIVNKQVSFNSAITLALFCAAIYFANLNNFTMKRKINLYIMLIIITVVSSAKMMFVIALIYIIPWYKKDFKLKLNYIINFTLIGIVFFYIFNGLTNRLVGGQNLALRIFNTINGYLIGGIAIFQRVLDGDFISYSGWIKSGNWVGNVYSAFYYWIDGGISKVVFAAVLIGALYGLLNIKGRMTEFLRIYSLFPLFFIFFDELFIKAILQWICFAIAGILSGILYDSPKRRI